MRSFCLRLFLPALMLALLVGWRSSVSLRADEKPRPDQDVQEGERPHHKHPPEHGPGKRGPHREDHDDDDRRPPHGPPGHRHEHDDDDDDHDRHHGARDAVDGELRDVARSLRSIDQSYGFRGICGCGAYTAGSAFRDWRAQGVVPPHHGHRVLPPPSLVLGGCRSHCGQCDTCSNARRTCNACGESYIYGSGSGCGCHEGFNLRPHPPLPNDHYREPCGGAYNDGWHHHGVYHRGEALVEDDRSEAGCTILDRRICTGCGQVYPRDEQPKCGCQHDGHHDHHSHGPHGPTPDPTPVDGPKHHDHNSEKKPTPDDK